MNRRRLQRIALPLLAILFAVVATQQLRGLVWHRHHDRVIRIERVNSGHGHRHERHYERRHDRRHRYDERHEVVIHVD